MHQGLVRREGGYYGQDDNRMVWRSCDLSYELHLGPWDRSSELSCISHNSRDFYRVQAWLMLFNVHIHGALLVL